MQEYLAELMQATEKQERQVGRLEVINAVLRWAVKHKTFLRLEEAATEELRELLNDFAGRKD